MAQALPKMQADLGFQCLNPPSLFETITECRKKTILSDIGQLVGVPSPRRQRSFWWPSRYNEAVSLRLLLPVFALALVALFGTACKRVNIDTPEAVREAVVKHIEARGDIDLKDLDLKIQNVSFQGEKAQAEVSFVPSGQPTGSGMVMRYSLERDGDAWKVLPPKSPMGNMAPAPSTDVPPPPAAQSLPQGHPPLPPPTSPK